MNRKTNQARLSKAVSKLPAAQEKLWSSTFPGRKIKFVVKALHKWDNYKIRKEDRGDSPDA